MIQYWNDYIKPYKLYGNLYFTGAMHGSTHMIATPDSSLILIDSGYPQTLYQLLENIRSLGFNPANITHVIHSHGHYDHLGATRALIELYHPKTYLGAADLDCANGTRDLTYATELGYKYIETFEPDVLLNDGDVLDIDGETFTFLGTPGHTSGTMSIFFDINGEDGVKRCGMFGGAGVNTLSLAYLNKYSLPTSLRDDFLKSIDRAAQEHVDIHVGNHVNSNRMFEKLKKRDETGINAFVDNTDWLSSLERFRKAFENMCIKENNS